MCCSAVITPHHSCCLCNLSLLSYRAPGTVFTSKSIIEPVTLISAQLSSAPFITTEHSLPP
ncbi:hypothetical protein JZ751_001097 [Albula glossodonta]|uniref:Uncharacterized protein n=1 Tax=Albula glossodonta TaxID=121402 RepID=A0A8T2PSR7_9TELE|nr:hypothetical protein JZ751_001097 [Albula glossodonta]